MTVSTDKATATGLDFRVADLTLADWGRNEIRLAEQEMPGLMATREEYAASRPLAGLTSASLTLLTTRRGTPPSAGISQMFPWRSPGAAAEK